METRRSILRAGGAAGALGALVLTACAGAQPAGGASGPPDAAGLTASLTYLGNHNQAEAQVVQPQLEGFSQRFPRARVQVTNLTAGYDEKLQSMLAGGTPPDLFRTGGTGWAQYANQGAIAEIGSRVTRDKYDLADFIEAAVRQYSWKGRHVGLGSNVGYSLFYYNTALFRDHGVPEPGDDWARPWTWERFTDALKRVATRDAAGEPERFGFTGLNDFHRLLVLNGARLTNDDDTRTLYDSPEAVETWEWLADLVHAHKVAHNPLTYARLSPVTAFVQGRAAVYVTSTANGVTQLVPQPDLPWDVAPTAKGPRVTREQWIYGGGSVWLIAAASPAVDATWELLKHLESPEVGHNLALGGFAPIRYSVLNSPAWLRGDQPPRSKKPLVDGLKRLLPFPKLINFSQFDKAITDEVQALWTGERRGREVAQRIRAATDPILAEHQRAIK